MGSLPSTIVVTVMFDVFDVFVVMPVVSVVERLMMVAAGREFEKGTLVKRDVKTVLLF